MASNALARQHSTCVDAVFQLKAKKSGNEIERPGFQSDCRSLLASIEWTSIIDGMLDDALIALGDFQLNETLQGYHEIEARHNKIQSLVESISRIPESQCLAIHRHNGAEKCIVSMWDLSNPSVDYVLMSKCENTKMFEVRVRLIENVPFAEHTGITRMVADVIESTAIKNVTIKDFDSNTGIVMFDADGVKFDEIRCFQPNSLPSESENAIMQRAPASVGSKGTTLGFKFRLGKTKNNTRVVVCIDLVSRM